MVSSLLREMGAGDEVSIVDITVIFKKAVVDMLILGAIYYHTFKHIKHICIIQGEKHMAKISKSLTELIGKTPLLELSNY